MTTAAVEAPQWGPVKVDPSWRLAMSVGGESFTFDGAVPFDTVTKLADRWFSAIDAPRLAQAAVDTLVAQGVAANARLAEVVDATIR